MDRPEDDALKFINALIKSLQNLCHGYLHFQSGIEIIGHINLSVDKGHSLDYVLKEKVCRNAENSTSFISSSFHAEPKLESLSKKSSDNQNSEYTDPDKLPRSRERPRRTSDAEESHSYHSQHRNGKRKLSVDESGEYHFPKRHSSTESSFAPGPSNKSKSKLTAEGPDGDPSETLLPQTASVTDSADDDIGVNLAGSVLEPVENRSTNNRDDDDDSDNDLEVTFIKEEFADGENSACEFDSSGGQHFPGDPLHTEGMADVTGFPVGLHPNSSASGAFIQGTFDHGTIHQYPQGSSEPGSSGMRGGSGVPSFVNSLSAFGSLGAPGLPLGQICGNPASSIQNRMLSKSSGSKISVQRPGSGFNKSHTSLQRSFALHRDDKLRRHEDREEDMKQRLALMSELLALKGVSSAEDYKAAIVREKRRVAKKLYRASLPEGKRNEIKEKDKLNKRMKRAARWAVSTATSASVQHFSDCSSDMNSGKEFENVHQVSSFAGNFAAIGTVSVRDLSDKGHNSAGTTSQFSSDSARMATRMNAAPVSDENIHNIDSGSVECETGASSGCGISSVGSDPYGSVSRIGSVSAGTVTSMGSSSMDNFSSRRLAPVSTSSMGFGSVGSVPWIDSVSFDTGAQDQRNLDSSVNQRENYNIMKLNQR